MTKTLQLQYLFLWIDSFIWIFAQQCKVLTLNMYSPICFVKTYFFRQHGTVNLDSTRFDMVWPQLTATWFDTVWRCMRHATGNNCTHSCYRNTPNASIVIELNQKFKKITQWWENWNNCTYHYWSIVWRGRFTYRATSGWANMHT